jgi:hypothetical protein
MAAAAAAGLEMIIVRNGINSSRGRVIRLLVMPAAGDDNSRLYQKQQAKKHCSLLSSNSRSMALVLFSSIL